MEFTASQQYTPRKTLMITVRTFFKSLDQERFIIKIHETSSATKITTHLPLKLTYQQFPTYDSPRPWNQRTLPTRILRPSENTSLSNHLQTTIIYHNTSSPFTFVFASQIYAHQRNNNNNNNKNNGTCHEAA